MQEGKALVEIIVPAIDKSYDVYIPLECKMGDVLSLVSHTIKDLSGNFFLPNVETVLCDYITGQIFDINKCIYELNINNGSKLLLI